MSTGPQTPSGANPPSVVPTTHPLSESVSSSSVSTSNPDGPAKVACRPKEVVTMKVTSTTPPSSVPPASCTITHTPSSAPSVLSTVGSVALSTSSGSHDDSGLPNSSGTLRMSSELRSEMEAAQSSPTMKPRSIPNHVHSSMSSEVVIEEVIDQVAQHLTASSRHSGDYSNRHSADGSIAESRGSVGSLDIGGGR